MFLYVIGYCCLGNFSTMYFEVEYPCKLLVFGTPCLLLHEDVNLATPNSQKGEGAQQQTPVPCQQKSGPLL